MLGNRGSDQIRKTRMKCTVTVGEIVKNRDKTSVEDDRYLAIVKNSRIKSLFEGQAHRIKYASGDYYARKKFKFTYDVI